MLMCLVTLALEVTVALMAILCIWWYTRRPKKMPPGPWGVPILGQMPFMEANAGENFVNLGKKYGPIVSYDMGMTYNVVLNEYALIKKAFQDMGDVFSGRTDGFGELILQTQDSFICQEGLIWQEKRKFSYAALKEFGLGKSSLEPKILSELEYYMSEIKSKNGEPFDIFSMLAVSMSNVASLLEFNQRYEYNDPTVLKMRHYIEEWENSPMQFILGSMFPKLINSWLWKKCPFYARTTKCAEYQTEMVKAIYEKHKKEHYEGKNDDYIDACLTERAERIKRNDHPEYFDDTKVLSDLRLLTVGGAESAVVLIVWCFLYLIVHKDMQKKIHDEIDKVIGRNRQASWSDRLNMPYTEAFMTEILRYCSAPLLDGHCTTTDVEFEGYFIPKRTNVLGNAWAIHRDEKLFPDPHSFRPERFLDENNKFIKTDRVVTFGIGRRYCIGESLARMTMFHYFVTTLQNYELSEPEGEVLTTKAITHLAYVAQPFKMRVVERKEQ